MGNESKCIQCGDFKANDGRYSCRRCAAKNRRAYIREVFRESAKTIRPSHVQMLPAEIPTSVADAVRELRGIKWRG